MEYEGQVFFLQNLLNTHFCNYFITDNITLFEFVRYELNCHRKLLGKIIRLYEIVLFFFIKFELKSYCLYYYLT